MRSEAHPLSRLIGDWLVLQPSASGRSRAPWHVAHTTVSTNPIARSRIMALLELRVCMTWRSALENVPL